MKTKKLSFVIVLSFLVMLGCSDDGPRLGSIDDLSPYAKQFLTMRNSSFSNYAAESNGIMNNSFRSLMQSLSINGRLKGDTTETDTTLYPNPWEWTSCAVVTEIQNDDGSVTNIRDYGDGCEEGYPGFYYWIHGKITSTSKYRMEEEGPVVRYDYMYKGSYDNYGGRYVMYNGDTAEWANDGDYDYNGKAEYNTETQTFIGEYNHKGDSKYSYNGEESSYKSEGHTKYTVDGWITDIFEYEYSFADYFYSSKVTEPLVFDYSCNNSGDGTVDWENYIWLNVSGKEVVHYRQDGQEGSFVIDYGDGECDNIIWITENGVTVKVDLGHWVWFCGTTTE
jgi:hypothetical protein